MRLVATRQVLIGGLGTFLMGQEFDAPDDVAKQLMANGVARHPDPPRVVYQTKVITPEAPEVSARHPFRHSGMFDAESAELAAEGDSSVPESDVSERGVAHPGGRGRRTRPASE